MPSVEAAFDLAGLLDEFDASVAPALLSAAFEGFDDRGDDFAIDTLPSARRLEQIHAVQTNLAHVAALGPLESTRRTSGALSLICCLRAVLD